MLKIRNNVFETNSSSMHSVAVLKRKPTDSKITLADAMAEDNDMCVESGVLKITDDGMLEFGWKFDIIDTAFGRIRYAIASYGENGFGKVLDAVRTVFPEIKDICLPIVDGVPGYTGSIDHQSFGVLQSHIHRYGYTLSDFICDSNALVIIDNDNSCHFHGVVEAGIFDTDSVEKCEDLVPYDWDGWDELKMDTKEDKEND